MSDHPSTIARRHMGALAELLPEVARPTSGTVTTDGVYFAALVAAAKAADCAEARAHAEAANAAWWSLALTCDTRAHRAAWRVASDQQRVADLHQSAREGLYRAAQRYDPLCGVAFSTYAQFWMMAALAEELGDSVVKVPRKFTEIRLKAKRLHGLDTSAAAEKIGCKPSDLAAALAGHIVRKPTDPEADDPIDSETHDPTESVEDRADIAAALARLCPRDREIAEMCLCGMTMPEIRRALGVANRASAHHAVNRVVREIRRSRPDPPPEGSSDAEWLIWLVDRRVAQTAPALAARLNCTVDEVISMARAAARRGDIRYNEVLRRCDSLA